MVRIFASTASVEENFLRNTSSFCHTERTYEARMRIQRQYYEVNMKKSRYPFERYERYPFSDIFKATNCLSIV